MFRQYFFDKAIAAFDEALEIEPHLKEALGYRGLSRIKKYQFLNAALLSKYSKRDLLTSTAVIPIPNDDQKKICNDLQQAENSGFYDRFSKKMIIDAIMNYCQKKARIIIEPY